MKRFLAAILMITVLLSTAIFAEGTKEWTQMDWDFKQGSEAFADSLDLVWNQKNFSKFTEAGLERNDGWFSVATFKRLGKNADSVEAYVDFQPIDALEEDLCGVMIGVRNRDTTHTHLNGGVWFGVKQKQISVIAGGKTDQYIKITNLPFSLDQVRRYTIKDTGDKTELYIDNTLIVAVTYQGDNVLVQDDKGTQLGTIATDGVPEFGSFIVMPHFCDVIIEKMGYKTYEEVAFSGEYVPTNPLIYQDVYSDTWVATDGLDRTVGGYDTKSSYTTGGDVPAPKDREVGIFYLMTHDPVEAPGDGQIYDFSAAFARGGVDAVWDEIPKGPLGFAHYWAQPYLGYYRSDDPWIIRKHAEQLSNAGVDFLFIDNTNGITYTDTYMKIFEIFHQMREEGQNTPQIAFFGGVQVAKVVTEMYNQVFKNGYYKDLWYMWDGKPLLLLNNIDQVSQLSDELRNFFTIKSCWAFTDQQWYTSVNGKDCWPWADMTPQRPGKDAEGNVEQMVAMCGFWANGSGGNNAGRSFHDGKEPETSNFGFDLFETSAQGLAFAEQLDNVLKTDPKVMMLTGWNEWWAGRWEDTAHTQRIGNTYVCDKNDPVKRHYYVDAMTPEFSRDIESMKGGWGDSYYYQMADGIRKFKGARPIPASNKQETIDMNSFYQWTAIGPEYRDNTHDTEHRNWQSYVGSITYVNASGRNDITMAKVTRDSNYVYFYVETAADIVEANGTNWMNLFIDADQSRLTGWEGYDYVINRQHDENVVSIEANVGGEWSWKNISSADYKIMGNKMHIKVAASDLGIDFTKGFDFKWADNSVRTGVVMEFIDQGDAAPAERFNFRYTETEAPFALSSENLAIAKGKTMLMVNRNVAFVDGVRTYVDPQNASVKPMIVADRTLVPLRFIAESIGAEVSWDQNARTATVVLDGKTVTATEGENAIYVDGARVETEAGAQIINDRTMLPLRAVCEALGKTLTWDSRGLIVIGDEQVEDTRFLNEMARTL